MNKKIYKTLLYKLSRSIMYIGLGILVSACFIRNAYLIIFGAILVCLGGAFAKKENKIAKAELILNDERFIEIRKLARIKAFDTFSSIANCLNAVLLFCLIPNSFLNKCVNQDLATGCVLGLSGAILLNFILYIYYHTKLEKTM